jgi:Zn-dependent protease with chaperone function
MLSFSFPYVFIGDASVLSSDQVPVPAAASTCCPSCHTLLPAHEGFVVWCDQCGWNLQPHTPEQTGGLLGDLYRSIGQRSGRALLDRIVQSNSFRPAWTTSKIPAFALETAIHGLTIISALLGVFLIVRGWPHLFMIVAGILCLGLAWVLRPRVGVLEDSPAPRESFPNLYRLVDQIAQVLDTPTVSAIVVDKDFNAAFGQVGWQQKQVMYLGLPFFSILDGQEKVALIAHELAHGVNGDPVRSLVCRQRSPHAHQMV